MNKLFAHLDQLVGALALDGNFRKAFEHDQLGAIQHFNKVFAIRYRQKPLELSNEELKLVTALRFDTVEEFIDLVAIITDAAQSTPTTLQLSHKPPQLLELTA